ncbi:MAG: hypothetical protein ACXWKG_10430 [Limisphaerales bacterium]
MKLKQMLAIAGMGALMLVGSTTIMAQGRGNFDPAQMRERIMTRMREQMDVKDDAEWKVIEPRIGKVLDARMELTKGEPSGMGMMFGGRSRRGGSSSTDSAATPAPADQGSSRPRGGMFGQSPELEALQKAVDDKAGKDEIQAKLTALRKSNKEKQKALDKAQSDLKEILDARQEAVAVVNGLVK